MLGDGRAEPNQPGAGGGPYPVAGYGHPTIQTISGPAPPPDMGSTGLKPLAPPLVELNTHAFIPFHTLTVAASRTGGSGAQHADAI